RSRISPTSAWGGRRATRLEGRPSPTDPGDLNGVAEANKVASSTQAEGKALDAQGAFAGVAALAGGQQGRIGVLLLNLGTPDATSYWPMRRYLKEFLSDRRVIELPRLKWWPILNLVILSVRPGKKGKDYDKIWNRERNESPLKSITRAQS